MSTRWPRSHYTHTEYSVHICMCMFCAFGTRDSKVGSHNTVFQSQVLAGMFKGNKLCFDHG
jgi:hypothetical protein